MSISTHLSHGQEAWSLDNGTVSLTVTRLGAQMAPVVFRDGTREIRPYYISPWQDEDLAIDCKMLVPLRGDFFCLPFGGNATAFRGEVHPPHGETCGEAWHLGGVSEDGPASTLSLWLETGVRRGRVTRDLTLIKDHPVVYSRTVVTGFAGASPFAHHAILAVPGQAGALRVSTSPFDLGMTVPTAFDASRKLLIEAVFKDLKSVPAQAGGMVDCSVFPQVPGHCDLLSMFERPNARHGTPAWVAAVNQEQDWLWFAFKDPALMPARMLWMENRGRQDAPWNGRNNCLGIEDGRMFFDIGLAESAAENPVTREGIPTVLDFPGTPVEIRYIQGAVPVPRNFGRVADVTFAAHEAVFSSTEGCRVGVPVDHGFLFGRNDSTGVPSGARPTA